MSQDNASAANKATQARETSADAAFALSLIGGIVITIGSVFGMGLGVVGRPFFWGMGGMMGGYYGGMMGGGYYYGTGGYYGMMYALEGVGLIAGVLVIIFALMMRSRPADRHTYGALVLAFSLISFVGMGGFLIGAVIGLVGGILALAAA